MCLQAQGTDDDNRGVDRVIQARRLSDDTGGVGRGQGIDDASEVSTTTMEASYEEAEETTHPSERLRRRRRRCVYCLRVLTTIRHS